MYIEKFKNPSSKLLQYTQREQSLNLCSAEFYQDFVKRILSLKKALIDLLEKLKSEGKTIVGYGAAAKANTLLSYFNIGKNYLEYIVDLSKYKQGLYFSGNHLQIVSPDRFIKDQPDYTLILAWNFAEEIMQQQSEYKKNGGKFIVPIPEVKIY